MVGYDYAGDALSIEERKAQALETIASKVTQIEQHQQVMQEKITQIEQHQRLIEQHEKCLCECCRNSAERTEATLQAALSETGDQSTGQEIWDARENLLKDS